MDTITMAGVIAGALVIVVTLGTAVRKGLDQWTVIALGVGALLLVGSKYTSFKVGPGGIEALQAKVVATAAAADAVAAQTEQATAAVKATQTQIANLAKLLEERHVLPAETTKPIRVQLGAAPKVDLTQLRKARSTLAGIRLP